MIPVLLVLILLAILFPKFIRGAFLAMFLLAGIGLFAGRDSSTPTSLPPAASKEDGRLAKDDILSTYGVVLPCQKGPCSYKKGESPEPTSEDAQVSASVAVETSDAYSPGNNWELYLIGKSDPITVTDVVVNRGCRPHTPTRLPQVLRFGDRQKIADYLCEPIEATVTTADGKTSIYKLDNDALTNSLVTVKLNQIGSVWRLTLTGHADQLEVTSIRINRGNCPPLQGNGQTPFSLRFGQRYRVLTLCRPIEVTVTTTKGEDTFSPLL